MSPGHFSFSEEECPGLFLFIHTYIIPEKNISIYSFGINDRSITDNRAVVCIQSTARSEEEIRSIALS